MADHNGSPFNPALVGPDGRLARTVVDIACPGCGKPCPRGDTTARRLSGGFGAVTDLCVHCGYQFDELTIPLIGKP